MKNPMKEALDKRHEKSIHVKISVEAVKPEEDKHEQMESEEATPRPEDYMMGDMRDIDKEEMMEKKPQGLHERVMKEVLKKKGKEKA